MHCIWGFIWHGRSLYHNWLFWLLVIATAAIALVFLLYHLRKKQQLTCPGCHSPVEPVYLRCPECGQALKSHCSGCHHIVDTGWQCCPHCKEALQSEAERKPSKAGVLPA